MTRPATERHAALAHRCPTCRRVPGRRCRTPRGRTVPPHLARVTRAVAAAEKAPRCPRLSPESRTPCDLPDLREWHHLGHEATSGPTSSVVWATDDADAARWEGAA